MSEFIAPLVAQQSEPERSDDVASPPDSSTDDSSEAPSSTEPSSTSSAASSSATSSESTSSGSATTSSSDSSGSRSGSETTSTDNSSSAPSTSSSDSSVDQAKAHADDIPPPTPQSPLIQSQFFTDTVYRMAHFNALSPFAERAIVKEWSTQHGCWVSRQTFVLIHHSAFARGSMRSSYWMIDFQCPSKNFVAKRYRKPSVPNSQYFDDVAMHSIAEYWASQFNHCEPPKRVRFVPAAVLELCFRSPALVFAIEPHLEGEFKKHNNNNGYVAEDHRCTPQAFSHFTFHRSGGQLMIVDIQGVGDDYTDPQIMSLDGEGYGRGNLGKKGMEKFLRSHTCNVVCTHLGLPVVGKPPQKPVRNASPPKGKGGLHEQQQTANPTNGSLNTPKRSQKVVDTGTSPMAPRSSPSVSNSGALDAHDGRSPAPAASRRRLPHLLRESLKTTVLIGAPSDGTDSHVQLVPIAPAPQADLSLMPDYFMGSVADFAEQSSDMSAWGTLSYVEGTQPVPSIANASQRRGIAANAEAAACQILVEKHARRTADKDSVLVDE